MRSRRLIAAFAAACLAALGTAPGRAAGDHGWTVPGTLRVGLDHSPNSLDPVLQNLQVESFIESFVFDPLVLVLPDGTTEPVLATTVPTRANGGISVDGRTITFHLRHGVRWHDGAPFTSADVAFTQRAMMNPANNVPIRQPCDRVVRLTTPDPFTVVVRLDRPYAPFLAQWLANGVLPAHLLAARHDLNNDPFNSMPIGTGAFRVVRWERGRGIELTANDAYFDGRPGLRHVTFSILPNETTAAIGLRTHQIDWLYSPSAGAVRALVGAEGVQLERFDAIVYQGLMLNVTRPALGDVRVRRALSLAIDRASIVAKLTGGFATVAAADIPAFLWAADPSLHADYDPARAQALLDAAGWRRGPDGIRVRNGTRLSLVLAYSTGRPTIDALVVQAQAMLRAVGVDVDLRGYDTSLIYSFDGPFARGTFDLGFEWWFSSNDPDSSQFLSCAARAPAGNNYTRWCSPTYERWNDVAMSTYDRAARRSAYAHIERTILDEVPTIFIDHPIDVEPVNVDLTGFRDHDTYGRPYRYRI